MTSTSYGLNLFKPSAVFHIETSHLIGKQIKRIWSVNQMTGFYMKCNTGLKCINIFLNLSKIENKTIW